MENSPQHERDAQPGGNNAQRPIHGQIYFDIGKASAVVDTLLGSTAARSDLASD